MIELVITIILLIILAGVILTTILGQENIIENAENAVGKYNNEVNTEQETLNAIEKFFAEKTDINSPSVKAKQESVTIISGEKYEISDLFQIEPNGASKIKVTVAGAGGSGKGGLGGAYPAQDYRYPETGGNGWIYIEYGGDI